MLSVSPQIHDHHPWMGPVLPGKPYHIYLVNLPLHFQWLFQQTSTLLKPQTFSSLPAETFVSHFTEKTEASAETLNCPIHSPPVTIKAMPALLSKAIPWLSTPPLSTPAIIPSVLHHMLLLCWSVLICTLSVSSPFFNKLPTPSHTPQNKPSHRTSQ